MFRKATLSDAERIAAIYDLIHTQQELGLATTGWVRDIYPTANTARAAIAAGDMYVHEQDGNVIAAGRINKEQGEEYKKADWSLHVPDDRVLVLHTLVVDPAHTGKGIASAFVAYYETFAKEQGCLCLRMDTNERNTAARALYRKLGFTECSIVPCRFNGIDNVNLVCLEKLL